MAAERKTWSFNAFYLMMAVLGVVLLRDIWVATQSVSQIPYSEFQQLLDEGKVSDLVITDTHIRGSVKEPLANGQKQFITNRVEEDLAAKLAGKGITFARMIENTFIRDVLSWVLPVLLFFLLWMYLMRRMAASGGMGGQLMSIGKSKAKVYMETDTGVDFNDVAGVDEAKAELVEIVQFLKDQKTFARLGARMPKGVLLVGPPGTGKTLLAKAVAGEAAVPFFSISGSEFVEMFVGVGAARVRDLFEQARVKSPCIIFIDELDALGRSRAGNAPFGGHDEKEQTLNQLLVEMDGFDSGSGIVLLAATNRPEILDPALLRAGRFDRQVLVDRPDRPGRVQILNVHVRKIKLAPTADLEQVAAMTPGFTGADLANLVNEAALVATRRQAEQVDLNDFTQAIERIVAGIEKRNRLMSPREREIVAFHEMGHALVGASLPNVDQVHKVSIIPRGIGALGYTMQRPTEDRYILTSDELENKIAVLLGGRASELLMFQHLSTGAADDISRASDVAREMVARYGMNTELGHATYDREPANFLGQASIGRERLYSEQSAQMIDRAVRDIVNRGLKRAQDILQLNRPLLEECARVLLQRETLNQEELAPYFARLLRPE